MEQSTEKLFIKNKLAGCEVCAYQESGHILFAYLCGYYCRQVQLLPQSAEYSGIAVYDFGKDSEAAARLMNVHTELDYFRCLSLGEKLEYIETGHRLARLFLGGSIAAAIYNNGGNPYVPLPVQVDYLDLMQVEFIEKALHEMEDKEEQFIEYILQDALYTLGNINIWQTVEDLAGRLLQHGQLDRNDIEECLEEHGISFEKAASGGLSLY